MHVADLSLVARSLIGLGLAAIAQTVVWPPDPCPPLVTAIYDFGDVAEPVSAYQAMPAIEQLAEGPNDLLIGTSAEGGQNGAGTLFRLDVRTRVLEVLHHFSSAGSGPLGGVTYANPRAWGTSYGGGTYGGGTIFRIDLDRPVLQIETTTNLRNGSQLKMCPSPPCRLTAQEMLDTMAFRPKSIPVMANDGNFYGVTSHALYVEFGLLYKITAGGLYSALCAGTMPPNLIDQRLLRDQLTANCLFNGKQHGTGPIALTLAADKSSLYGTTRGQSTLDPHGTIFSATLAGKVSTRYRFRGPDGSWPNAVVEGPNGILYGTTYKGGPTGSNLGVVFQLRPGAANPDNLHVFQGGRLDGGNPTGLVIVDGFLYGTALEGGKHLGGILYRIELKTGAFAIIHDFDSINGRLPASTPLLHSNGNMYGTTVKGGRFDKGVIYVVNLRDHHPQGAFGTAVPLFKDDAVEVSTGVAVVQDDKAYSDTVAITDKCAGEAHVVQFVRRTTHSKDGTVLQTAAPYRAKDRAQWEVEHRQTTDLKNPIWRVDSRGRPNPYYETGRQYRCDAGSLTVFDEPTLATDPAGNTLVFTAVAYTMCNGQVTREVEWKRSSFPDGRLTTSVVVAKATAIRPELALVLKNWQAEKPVYFKR